MRMLLLLLGCATLPEHPPRTADECVAQCQVLADLCAARCSTSQSPRMGVGEAMGASECRSSCWSRDANCRRECEDRFRPKR
jgi:hypothetical protein